MPTSTKIAKWLLGFSGILILLSLRAFSAAVEPVWAAASKLYTSIATEVSPRPPTTYEVLEEAIKRKDTYSVQKILASGVPITPECGNSALGAAAFRNNLPIAKLLLKSGVPTEYRSEASSPLMLAAEEGHPQMVELLLQHGANPNYATEHHDWTALMSAAMGGNERCVQLLLNRGAKVNAKDYKYRTAYSLAIDFDNKQAASILRKAGAE